jgi:hypothetical protein
MSFLNRSFIFIVCGVLPLIATAQSASKITINGAAAISQMVLDRCPQTVSSLFDKPEFRPVLSAHPINVSAVCSCTQANFMSDTRLQTRFDNVTAEGFAERMKSEHFKAYFTMRLMHSLLKCSVPEVAEALAKSSP